TPLLSTSLLLPLLLLILSIQDPTEACRCAPANPQQQICSSDIVICATIWSKEVIIDSVSSLKIIQYEIKHIKIFKGFEKAKDVQYVFTPLTSRYCGVKLKVNKKKKNQYLLSG
uniref:Metalloproteinase inhibitor 4 n=1 Tax=Laticauda laticaudata TaxID=8630 RepID=A0A8C5SBA7_LATLA